MTDDVLFPAESADVTDDVLFPAESANVTDDVLFPAESADVTDDVLFPAESADVTVCSGGSVQANGRGRRQVQALRESVDPDPDPEVGQFGHVGRQPVGLRAEHPGGPPGQPAGVRVIVEIDGPVRIRGQHAHPGRPQGLHELACAPFDFRQIVLRTKQF